MRVRTLPPPHHTCIAELAAAGTAQVDRLLHQLEQNLENAKLSLKRGCDTTRRHMLPADVCCQRRSMGYARSRSWVAVSTMLALSLPNGHALPSFSHHVQAANANRASRYSQDMAWIRRAPTHRARHCDVWPMPFYWTNHRDKHSSTLAMPQEPPND